MEAEELQVLRLTTYERDVGTIAFLYRERNPSKILDIEQVGAILQSLRGMGLVEQTDPSSLWRIRPAGQLALREAAEWRFTVEEMFAVSGRERPIVVGQLHKGSVALRDHFLVRDTDRHGTVIAIPLHGPGRSEAALSLSLDIDVSVGDELVRVELPPPG